MSCQRCDLTDTCPPYQVLGYSLEEFIWCIRFSQASINQRSLYHFALVEYGITCHGIAIDVSIQHCAVKVSTFEKYQIIADVIRGRGHGNLLELWKMNKTCQLCGSAGSLLLSLKLGSVVFNSNFNTGLKLLYPIL